jgi:hypothetical protein
MVDWDRVEELRSKGWDWDRIAADSKVGFHPDSSVQDPGRALRGLYHRQRSRAGRRGDQPAAPNPKKLKEQKESQWTLARIGYLATPILALWLLFAYVAPSPVGLVLPAFPWLALGTAVAAFILLFGLWRTSGPRWSKPFRTTLVWGVVLGLVVSGVIALTGTLLFGCPYLPPQSALATQSASGTGSGSAQVAPWLSGNMRAWQDDGRPVVFFYGASWCPYCSAGSWAVYKALSEFGNVTPSNSAGAALYYSDPNDVYASTPEIVLSFVAANYSSQWVSLQTAEYVGSPSGHTFPGTSNCYQSAYVGAYSGGSIPFLTVNGQYIHGGSQLVYPQDLSTWAGSGASTVLTSLQTESGAAWTAVQFQSYWVMAFLAKSIQSSSGVTVSQLASDLKWTSATRTGVQTDVNAIS